MLKIPFKALFLVFLLAEIAAFILVGGALGVLPTLGLVLAAMLGGAILLRWTGVATLARMRSELAAGGRPAPAAAEGALLAVAALLIMLPGFLSDLAGLALLVPAVRRGIGRSITRRFAPFVRWTSAEGRAGHPVIELDRSEYDRKAAADSPWRREAPPPQ